MSNVNFSMAVQSEDDLQRAMQIAAGIVDGETVMTLSLSHRAVRKGLSEKELKKSIKERVLFYLQSSDDGLSASVISNRLRLPRDVVEAELDALYSNGEAVKSTGRNYRGRGVIKWRVA